MSERHGFARSEGETEALGAALARAMPRPERGPAMLCLEGELGVGKTTLARGFLRGLGFAGRVRSPTFALIECYEVGALRIAHIDLYRIAGPSDLESLALRDLAHPGAVWLVEWPERAAQALPPCDLSVRLELPASGPGREIVATSRSAFGATWLANTVEIFGEGT